MQKVRITNPGEWCTYGFITDNDLIKLFSYPFKWDYSEHKRNWDTFYEFVDKYPPSVDKNENAQKYLEKYKND